MGSQHGEGVRHGDVAQVFRLVVVPCLVGVHDTDKGEALALGTMIQTLHRSKFHGLMFGYLHRGAVARVHGKQQTGQSDPAADLDRDDGELAVVFLKEQEAAYGDYEHTCQGPAAEHRVEELVDRYA